MSADRHESVPIARLLLRLLSAVAVGLSCGMLSAGMDEPESGAEVTAKIRFFERHVRPLLVESCSECHSGESPKGHLNALSGSALREGGDSGPAIIPGDPDGSLLIRAVRYEGLEMPPRKKLSADKVRVLEEWIRNGAVWPNEEAEKSADKKAVHYPAEITEDDRAHWSFRPVQVRPARTTGQTRTEIDAYLADGLSDAGLVPNDRASTSVLVRRAFFALTGLPPTFEELNSWVVRIGGVDNEPFSEDAWNALVDDLLSRPSYGEHWARHWLDVVRYAQTDGYERDGYKRFSWRYRDYVIRAFQHDKPYDRFVMEQLAGDELADGDGDSWTATGFYRLGAWDDEPDDKRQAEFDELDDIMVTTGAAFMGLTIGCARCHEHKFDPIPQSDYYRMLAWFRNIRRHENPIEAFESASALPADDPSVVRSAFDTLKARIDARAEAVASAASDDERARLQSEPVNLLLPELNWTLAVRERAGTPVETQVLIRGNAATPGATVTPGFLAVLSPASGENIPAEFRSESPLSDITQTSGRRLAFARWLTDPSHPLTARVMVNRVWHYHFGKGIVATTADFGRAGDSPSHPELLDWLADVFVHHGWSIRHLHRLILSTDAWRRSSHVAAESDAVREAMIRDPENRLLWRFPLRRLEAESIRDRMLASSGELNLRVGGREMYPSLRGEVLAGQSKPGLGWEQSPVEEQCRRSIYAVVKRSVRDPLLEALDYSNTTSPLTERPVTTVAPQALLLLHGQFTADRAHALAERLMKESADSETQIQGAYQSVLQRVPTEREQEIAREVLSDFRKELTSDMHQLVFRTDVPVSLYSPYRQQLSGDRFLTGPAQGWDYRSGVWGGGYEGIDVVEPRLGPHAFWKGREFREGTVTASLCVDSSAELITLLACARPAGDAWQGLAVTQDQTQGVLQIRDRADGRDVVSQTPCRLQPGEWYSFRCQITAGQMTVEMRLRSSDETSGDKSSNVMRLTHTMTSAPQSGRFGVAVWGGEVTLDDLRLQPGDSPEHEASDVIDVAHVRVPVEHQIPPGWSRYDGNWQRLKDGAWMVGQNTGAKLIWDSESLVSGEVCVEMKMTPGQARIGGLLLCVSEPKVGADNWYGYEVSLNAESQTVMLGDHRNNFRMISERPVSVRPGEWHHLRVRLDEERLIVFVDHAENPSLDVRLTDRLSGTQVGLRTWGSEIQYRNLELRRESGVVRSHWPETQLVRMTTDDQQRRLQERALSALCRTLMNLNEFVYVE